MADRSKIEWTGATWNPVTGCSITSPGCKNCYAMVLAGTRMRSHPSRAGLTDASKAGPVWNGQVRLNEGWLTQPLRWKRPRLIFVCAHGDLFHENVPDAWIDRVFAVMALCPQHTFQVLTKRSARMRSYLSASGVLQRWADEGEMALGVAKTAADSLRNAFAIGSRGTPLPNVWLGVSAEDQIRADQRIPDLLATPAALRFVSAEPLLGPIDLFHVACPPESQGEPDWTFNALTTGSNYEYHDGEFWMDGDGLDRETALDWIIVGGENGPRPMHPDWARAIRNQCAPAHVPFFFKQWGSWGPGARFEADLSARKAYRGEIQTLQIAGSRDIKIAIPTGDDDRLGPPLTLEHYGKKTAGRLLDGVEHNGMPEVRHAA